MKPVAFHTLSFSLVLNKLCCLVKRKFLAFFGLLSKLYFTFTDLPFGESRSCWPRNSNVIGRSGLRLTGPIGHNRAPRSWGTGTSLIFKSTQCDRGQLKCDGTRAESRFRLSAKRTSPFKSVGASVQSTTGSRGVRISGSNAGYTMFRDSVKSTGYPLHLPVSPSIPLPYVTVFHHISTGVYHTKLSDWFYI